MEHNRLPVYGMGWGPDEVSEVPPAPLQHPNWTWVHTGASWVAVPPRIYAVWRAARQEPVTWPVIAQALEAQAVYDVSEPLHTWWRNRLWLVWPWSQNPYGGVGEAHFLTLATVGSSPASLIPESVWGRHPSLAQLQSIYQDITHATERRARAWVEQAVPVILREGRGHLVYGRQGLPLTEDDAHE